MLVFFIHHSDHLSYNIIAKSKDEPKFFWFTDRYFDQITFGENSAYKYLFLFVDNLSNQTSKLFFRGNIDLNDALDRMPKFKKWANNRLKGNENKSFYEEPPILLSSGKIEPSLIAEYNETARDFCVIYPANYNGIQLNLFNSNGYAKNFLETKVLDLLPQIEKAFPFIEGMPES